MQGKHTVTTSIAYIAGFFDGEGCIRIKKSNQGGNSYYITANITNTNRQNLEFVQNIFGGQIREQEKGTNKTIYQYYLSASEAVDMLKVLLSFLIEKRTQAELAIQFHEYKEGLTPQQKAEYYDKMRSLKVIGNIYENPELYKGE